MVLTERHLILKMYPGPCIAQLWATATVLLYGHFLQLSAKHMLIQFHDTVQVDGQDLSSYVRI
ncbi:MAG: hypothetical protein CMM55_03105 [Rhodospirillaceae bacterium]|nr:hypothetical protein [Rhodospirillaceae bacterium]